MESLRQTILTVLLPPGTEAEWTAPRLAASVGQGGWCDVERALAELEVVGYVSRAPRAGRTYPCYVLAARGRRAVEALTRTQRTA